MTHREKVLIIRWSIFVAVVMTGIWTAWDALIGDVPSSNTFLPWFTNQPMPFSISRWWDAALIMPVIAGLWGLYRLQDVCEEKDWNVKQPGDGAMGAIVVSCLGMMAGCLVSAPFSSDQDTGFFAMLIGTASIAMLYGTFSGFGWVTLNACVIMSMCALSVNSYCSGPFHALLWSVPIAVVMAIGVGAGLIVRQLRYPLGFIAQWLGGKGVTDDPPEKLPKAMALSDANTFDRK